MKPDMGIFMVRSNINNKYYIEATQDLKGTMNKTKFQLKFNSFLNKELQKAWKEQGESNFTIEILEKLQYDKDESKTDYSEDLALLQMIWEEKLSQKGMEFYQR